MVKRSHICLIYKAFHKKTAKKWGDSAFFREISPKLALKQKTIPRKMEDG